MQSKLRIIAAALLLGTATLASAQVSSRAATFASQLGSFQTLSANTASTYAYKAAPNLNQPALDPVGHESFGNRVANLQAESSNSTNFEPAPVLTRIAADPVGHPSFADTFAQLQAASSNSGEYASRPGTGAPAALAGNFTVLARKTVN
jgi:hypothetical protein